MNTILSIANGALQYHRGKQTGLAGLFGIALALLIVFQWEHILPVLEAVGIVSFLDKHGLIYEGEPGLTGFVLLMIAYRAAIAFCIVGALLIVVGLAISIFLSSEIGLRIMFPVLALILSPFIILYMIYYHYKVPKNVKDQDKAKFDKMHKPVSKVIEEASEEIDKYDVSDRLNRIPTYGDDLFFLAVTREDEYVILVPTPDCLVKAGYDVYGLKYTIEKFWRGTNQPKGMLDPEEIKLISEDYLTPFRLYELKEVYQTKQVDVLREFSQIKHKNCYGRHIYEIQKAYFEKKDEILKRMSSETDKEQFDWLVTEAKQFNAINEEMVRLMINSKKGATLSNG